ncbi:hypothetical protein JCGZ_10524 [Jatropha curcas]|uniref:Uncharacterized protein n=1 Tax=Jatropha curcas TaxID=180498 RepID=A0A067KI39_JATCU|nr:uncharacterized protein LOC105636167 [Jatropha curcas]XP_037492436.1 uncharacterized protein LOC105636167 [Jatropha curcas]KDP35752.1 hypothetical protein JCGZ_10524 [Jatropha curcas]
MTMDGLESGGINGGVDGSEKKGVHRKDETLYSVLHSLLAMIFVPESGSSVAAESFLQRIKISVSENGPLLKDATKNTGRKVLLWTRRGSPLRALLVISVGTITLLTLTGLLVFMLFFLAATVNAIVVSLLISLAAAGGFLALFFACVTAVYIGALSVALFVISTTAISAIVAVLIATGWIGFFWTVWLVTKKSVGVAKHSLSMTGSAISAYSSARHLRRYHEVDKVSD